MQNISMQEKLKLKISGLGNEMKLIIDHINNNYKTSLKFIDGEIKGTRKDITKLCLTAIDGYDFDNRDISDIKHFYHVYPTNDDVKYVLENYGKNLLEIYGI